MNINVLIVDDTPFNIMGLKMLLTNLQINNIDQAFNGQEALELIKNKNENEGYDIIFMDVNMPIMDGIEATQKLRALINKKLIR